MIVERDKVVEAVIRAQQLDLRHDREAVREAAIASVAQSLGLPVEAVAEALELVAPLHAQLTSETP